MPCELQQSLSRGVYTIPLHCNNCNKTCHQWLLGHTLQCATDTLKSNLWEILEHRHCESSASIYCLRRMRLTYISLQDWREDLSQELHHDIIIKESAAGQRKGIWQGLQ